MAFELPSLPYEQDALEPYISARTISYHYGKHHQGYVNNLNNLVKSTQFENASLELIIRDSDGGILNNGAQIWNHTFYFTTFSPTGRREPYGKLGEVMNSTFGSFEGFKQEFAKAAVTLFGSGWAWLVKTAEGSLDILQESNAGNPLRQGLIPLLTFDVWEHAYYLDYQNNRAAHLDAIWNIIDWEVVTGRFA